ncbi:hypothetical protein [Oscillatoria sp. FACHB-1406]|uniref:hypothetical protein n=1 Tax=Oscillatoria sp. FACHB-1406 TaxID=2692846 RepID=UPI00168399C1|nr:hypothetical protein [Oscillatoria sp. FACHB-1406]MBD2576314.1 hypothetical protein [Oscillatoria sp. FACHB-1406]
MSENLAATLGELQSQIYWLHDAENFSELALAAAQIYQKLGYGEEQAQTAGQLISEAYQLADRASLAQEAGHSDREMQFYDRVNNKLTEVEIILDYSRRIARHQMEWWRHFRHKRKFQVLRHLFLQNLKAVGFRNIWTALKLTYFLQEIGRVHKQRDLETTKRNAKKYWYELLKTKPLQYPYLG